MNVLFVAIGILVLTLLALLLWFVPHLLQQQATRMAGETAQLREMLLDLLNEQEAVTMRQTQLGSSLARLQDQIESIVQFKGNTALPDQQALVVAEAGIQQLEARLSELQRQLQGWIESRQNGIRARDMQDNESWAYLLSLLSAIQERVGALSQDRASALAGLQASTLLEELEQEMHNLRGISEEIARLQWRLHRSLHERGTNLSILRSRASNGAS